MLELLDMADGLDYPALAHCKTGADRAGLFAAAFLHGVEGRPVGLAQRQLSLRYGHFRQAKTGILDFFFERYVRDTGGQGFRRWIEEDYDPAALKADFMSQWWATPSWSTGSCAGNSRGRRCRRQAFGRRRKPACARRAPSLARAPPPYHFPAMPDASAAPAGRDAVPVDDESFPLSGSAA